MESLWWKARKAKRYYVCEFAIQSEDPITKPIIQTIDEKLLIRKSMRAWSSRVEIILSSEYILYFCARNISFFIDCAIVAFSLLCFLRSCITYFSWIVFVLGENMVFQNQHDQSAVINLGSGRWKLDTGRRSMVFFVQGRWKAKKK